MSEDFDTVNLFDSFGLGAKVTSTPTGENKRIKFDDSDADNETDVGSIQTADEVGDSPRSLAGGDNVSEQSVSIIEDSEIIVINEFSVVDEFKTLNVPVKFLKFLDKIAGTKDTFEEKLEFLMKYYENDQKFKMSLPVSENEKVMFMDRTPKYENTFAATLDETDQNPLENIANSAEPIKKMCCFNCNGEHSIAECPEPKNEEQIRKNKQIHRDRQRFQQDSQRRYAEENEKYSKKFRPGVISKSLRNALKLSENEIPLWVYQMRVLGYPPGYLLDTLPEPSNLTMFDDNNVPIAPKRSRPSTDHISTKIHEYPGFNVAMPQGCKDMHHHYQMPPMLPHHQKDKFVEYILGDVYHVFDTSVNISAGGKNFTNDVCVDGSEPANPPLPSLPPPPLPSSDQSPESPTITDLERERQAILAQLATSNDDGGVNATDIQSGSIRPIADTDLVAKTKIIPLDSEVEMSESVVIAVDKNDSCYGVARSLSVVMGTPTMMTPTSSLSGGNKTGDLSSGGSKPSLENFRVGVTEFEFKEETLPCKGGGMKRIKEILKRKL